MKEDQEIIESAILGGLIGASLGALITSSKNGTGIGALAGAVVAASIKANKRARKTNVPVLIEQNNSIIELSADGTSRVIKLIPKHNKRFPKHFVLN